LDRFLSEYQCSLLLPGVGNLFKVPLYDARVVLAIASPHVLEDSRPQLARQIAPGTAGVLLAVFA
jgi:hypothetical protein